MTTNTPPTSPGSSSKKSSKKTQVPLEMVQEEACSSSTSNRIMRYAGFDGESVLAKPLLIDDLSLIPKDLVESTSLFLNKSGDSKISLEGSTDRLELFAHGTSSLNPFPFKYAVAVISADSEEPVRVWDAQVLITQKRVKRLKAVEESDAARLGAIPVESAATASIDYKTAQNLLGEAFGTRKRKQAIVSLEKNKVRADTLGQPASEFISQALADSKDSSAVNNAEATPVADVMASSLLPPYNKETLNVSEIYPIKGIIPQDCYKAMPVDDFVHVNVKTGKDELDALQARYGMNDFWFNRILSAPRDDGHHTLRLLIFGHFLSCFRELKEAAINGPDGSLAALQSRLFECPEAVAVDLLSRFADRMTNMSASADSTAFLGKFKHKLPNTLRDKAILYILALLLHTDNFRVNATSVSQLLSITPTKLVTFFKALGCTIDRPGRGEEMNVNINNRLVAVKFARLTAPLTFPLPPKRQSKK